MVGGGGGLPQPPLAQFYSGGAQPENSILRQQWRGKYLSKDQLWQSETHYKTMADCLAAWLLGCLDGCQGAARPP